MDIFHRLIALLESGIITLEQLMHTDHEDENVLTLCQDNNNAKILNRLRAIEEVGLAKQ